MRRWIDAAGPMYAIGRTLFVLSTLGLGVELLIFARSSSTDIINGYSVMPVLPWPPPIPWLGYAIGAVLIFCSAAMLLTSSTRAGAIVMGAVLFLCTLAFDIPRNASVVGGNDWRTYVFEPLALASLVWLVPLRGVVPEVCVFTARYLLALSLVAFGVDHFLALAPIGTMIPDWIPWHVFWVGFCGAGFVAAGIAIALNRVSGLAAGLLGLMFAIFVATIYVPPMVFHPDPDLLRDPDQWCNLLLNIALWGGSWAFAVQQADVSLRKAVGVQPTMR